MSVKELSRPERTAVKPTGRIVHVYHTRCPQVGDVAYCGHRKKLPPAPVPRPNQKCVVCVDLFGRYYV